MKIDCAGWDFYGETYTRANAAMKAKTRLSREKNRSRSSKALWPQEQTGNDRIYNAKRNSMQTNSTANG